MKTEFFSKVTAFIKLYGQSLFSNEKDVNKLIFKSMKLPNIDGFVNNGTNVTTAENGGKMPARHSVFNQILLDSSGKVAMNQFSVDAIKSRYSEDKYSVEEVEKNGAKSVFVKNKNTGLNEYAVEYEYDENNNPYYQVVDFDSKGDITRRIIVNNALIDGLIECNDDDSYFLTLYNGGNISDIASKTHRHADGSEETTLYNNSEKEYVLKYDKDDNFVSGERYVGGKLYGYCDENRHMTKYILVEDIAKKFDEVKNQNDAENFINYLKSHLTSKNIINFAEDYLNVSDDYFVIQVRNSEIFNENQKKEILEYYYSMISKHKNDSAEDCILKNKILFSMMDKDGESLRKCIESIQPDNAYNIISEFGEFSADSTDILCKRGENNLLRIILGSNMSNDDKNACIVNMLNKLFEYCDKNNICMDDILEDVNNHISDINMLEIDFVRLVSRSAHKMDNPPADIGVPDGKIDLNFEQGNSGNCWFIGGLKSIIRKGGAKYLESLMKIDDAAKTVTITIPNVNKDYVVSFDEISKFNFLSNNPNIRAFEIAVDKCMKEKAYEDMASLNQNTNKYKSEMINWYRARGIEYDDMSYRDMREDIIGSADIEGDSIDHTYEMFLPNSSCNTDVDISKADFNSDNITYSISFSGDAIIEAYSIDKKEYVYVDTHHAYIPISSDKDYIYVEDPRFEGSNIKIRRSDLQAFSVRIGESQVTG